MDKIAARADDTASQVDLVWQGRVDALICGACSEEEFMAELSSLRQSGGDAWSVVALLDQRYRRGQLPIELFRSIEAKIARRELGALDYGTTVELDMILAPPTVKHETGRASLLENARTGAAPAERVLRNRYVLEKQLGSGGMGTVFKAVDRYRCDLPQASRIVAIKFLHDTADHPETVSKLRREFYCAQALSHPNIVKVFELDRDDGIEFFTMEFLDGELLSGTLEKLAPAPLSRPRAWAIMGEVAAGLAHAHSRNVVHGDLKPQNIMITNSGETRILDFGASSAEIARKSNSSAMTPAYASCELLEGQGADPRDDLFALACLSYQLLAGQHPFQLRRSTAARDLGLIARRPRGLTRQQWRTLRQGLAWRREDRSISVADWMSRLRTGASTPRRSRLLRIAAVAAVIAGIASALIYDHRQSGSRNLDAAPQNVTDVGVGDSAAPDSSPLAAPAAGGTAAPVSIAAGIATPAAASGATLGAASAAHLAARQPPPTTRRADPATAKTPDAVSIAAGRYNIGAHQNFAEVHVRRSAGSGREASFAWWTEPGTASPGIDYVAPARTIQLLSSHSEMASLFVKLVPNAPRKHSAKFYVVIGEPGNGAALGRITRAAVVLPPQ
jgi:tRNA A-37 threonylcarbamoyl transferase component Bud32